MVVVSIILKTYLTHNFSRLTQYTYNCRSLGNKQVSKVQK